MSLDKPLSYLSQENVFRYLKIGQRRLFARHCPHLRACHKTTPIFVKVMKIQYESRQFEVIIDGLKWVLRPMWMTVQVDLPTGKTVECPGSVQDVMHNLISFYLNRKGSQIRLLCIENVAYGFENNCRLKISNLSLTFDTNLSWPMITQYNAEFLEFIRGSRFKALEIDMKNMEVYDHIRDLGIETRLLKVWTSDIQDFRFLRYSIHDEFVIWDRETTPVKFMELLEKLHQEVKVTRGCSYGGKFFKPGILVDEYMKALQAKFSAEVKYVDGIPGYCIKLNDYLEMFITAEEMEFDVKHITSFHFDAVVQDFGTACKKVVPLDLKMIKTFLKTTFTTDYGYKAPFKLVYTNHHPWFHFNHQTTRGGDGGLQSRLCPHKHSMLSGLSMVSGNGGSDSAVVRWRRMMVVVAVGVMLVSGGEAAKFLDTVSKQAISVLHGSQRTGEVRQCTCAEMKDCYESSKLQALDCFEVCWKSEIQRFKLTDNPDSLKLCFDAKRPFVDQVINCFQQKVKACTENGEPGVRVKEYDYRDMIKRVEDAVNAQVNSFLRSIGNENVKAVVNAGTAIAQCVKTCFLEKNKDGFCFTRIGCEPQIEDKNARVAIRQCSRSVQWKKEMETFCRCSSAAGINGLSSYCGMLNVIG